MSTDRAIFALEFLYFTPKCMHIHRSEGISRTFRSFHKQTLQIGNKSLEILCLMVICFSKRKNENRDFLALKLFLITLYQTEEKN